MRSLARANEKENKEEPKMRRGEALYYIVRRVRARAAQQVEQRRGGRGRVRSCLARAHRSSSIPCYEMWRQRQRRRILSGGTRGQNNAPSDCFCCRRCSPICSRNTEHKRRPSYVGVTHCFRNACE